MTAQTFTSLLQTSSNFPTAAMTVETSAHLHFMIAAALFATFAFFVSHASHEEKEKEEEKIKKEENKNDKSEKKKEKTEQEQYELVTAEGVAWRLAAGSLFLGLRAKQVDLRAVGGAGLLFPPAAGTANLTMNASTGVQLLSLSMILALGGLLVRSAKKDEEEQKEKAQEEASPEKKTKKENIELVSFDGVALKLAAGLLFLAVRDSWASVVVALRAVSSGVVFPSPMLAMEAPTYVCLLSLAALCFCFTALIRSSEAEEKESEKHKEEDTKEKDDVPRQHKVVSVDGIALRLGACCGLFGIYEAATSTGLLSTLRATFRTASFPPPMLAMETPTYVCLLSLAALCFCFTALIRSSEAEEKQNKKAVEEDTKEKDDVPRQHKVVSVDGIALRLGACCGLFGIYEAVKTTSFLPALGTALGSDEVAMSAGMLVVGTGLLLMGRGNPAKKLQQ